MRRLTAKTASAAAVDCEGGHGRTRGRSRHQAYIASEIGARLRQARLFRRVSQKALGAALGLSFQQIQKYEKGASRISANMLIAAAGFLKMPVHYFIDGLPVGNNATDATENTPHAWFDISGEAMTLARDFDRIANPKIRRLLASLVDALALEQE